MLYLELEERLRRLTEDIAKQTPLDKTTEASGGAFEASTAIAADVGDIKARRPNGPNRSCEAIRGKVAGRLPEERKVLMHELIRSDRTSS